MEPTTGYAMLGDESIAYQIIGDGPTDLIIAVGWWGSFDTDWDEPNIRAFFLQLARFSRVIRFDRRGIGASDPVPLDALPPWESLADEIEAVMDAVGSEAAVIIAAGNSGPAGALFAATRPDRTTGLILWHTSVRSLWDVAYPIGATAEEIAARLEALLEGWGSGGMVELAFPSRVGDPGFQRFFAKMQRTGASPSAMQKYLEAEATSDGRALLPTITVPTLVLHRTDSPATPIEHGRYMAEHIPNARLVEIPGGDVAPYWEYPELFIAAVEEFVAGTQSAREPDRQLATVMFTDIVDSTRRAEELGDRRWQALLDRHNEIAKQSVTDQAGRWIRSTGDGILATFVGPGRAIAGATSLQGGIANLDLHIRTGIHTGEIEVRGDDIGGIAVHLAARVMAEARADEILVSRTVKDLVVGSELTFEDRGVHSLKGIDESWQLFAVQMDGAGEASG
jgi:pimeloyl-ACP methyl ester carboxylesterase